MNSQFRGRATLVLSLLALITACSATAQMTERTGHAHDTETGALIYSEHHLEIYDGALLIHDRVTYRDAAGVIFATKEVDHRHAPFLPAFNLQNHRTGHIEAARHENGNYVVSFRSHTGSPLIERSLPLPKDGVGDAGFDRYILANWEYFRRGDTLTQKFLVPGMQRFFRFRIRPISQPAGTDAAGVMVLVVEPASAALRLFAEPLLLRYRADTPRLSQFVGLSNLRDANGDNLVVRIEFPEADNALALQEYTPP